MQTNSLIHPFVHLMYLRMSINSALQRAEVYVPNTTPHGKKAFKRFCSDRLIEFGNRYFAWEYDLNLIADEISALSNKASIAHYNVLDKGRLRIGVSQKMVSLYLKYLWLAGDSSKKPVEAVLDRGILVRSGYPNPPDWTALDDINLYKKIQRHIEVKAKSSLFGSPAVWEAETWSDTEINDMA